MGTHLRSVLLAAGVGALLATSAHAAGGKFGFADKPGGSPNDPVIEISASIGPNQGAVMSLTQEQANLLYKFDGTNTFKLATPVQTIPPNAQGAHQFIRIKFPFELSKSILNTVAKNKASFAPTSFLTPKLTITNESGGHVPGIVVVNGKTVDGTNVAGHPNFPTWLDVNGKNLLLGKKVLTYVADDGDGDLGTIGGLPITPGTGVAFGPTAGNEQVSTLKEIRIRLDEIGGVTVNGFWVLKMGDGAGGLAAGQNPVTMTNVQPLKPIVPTKFKNGFQVVEANSRFVVSFSEPVVPLSVGFSADFVQEFNAGNPLVPLAYNGNSGVVPNIDVLSLGVPFYPNFKVTASPNGVNSFTVPFDVRPRNPNNLAEYVVDPLLEMPGKVDVSLMAIPVNANSNPTATGLVSSAVTSLYNVQFNDASALNTKTFHTEKGRAFTNVPVAPQVLYFGAVSGTGLGAINLSGEGFETNDPATSRILILSNVAQVCFCTVSGFFPGPTFLGCNRNTFGDPLGNNPIGVADNPPGHLGGPTPVPGVNEGSSGSTANGANPNGIFPRGFETVCKNSDGDARLLKTPTIGAVGDIAVGDFLDTLFFDQLSPNPSIGLHTSLVIGGTIGRNSISDPPQPNPPPLRLPVGLQSVDIVFNQQNLLKPAFVMEGDEVWPPFLGCPGECVVDGTPAGGPSGCFWRVMTIPHPTNPVIGDKFPTYAQNGPAWQTHTLVGVMYGARQQIGNFLYVSDRDEGVIDVINSNNFAVIDRIKTSDPEGLAMAPDLRNLYVSNYGDDTVSIINVDPFDGNFHKETNKILVGSGPRAIAVQPDNEDVFVANYLGNTVSIIDPLTQTVRKTLANSISRPVEIVAGPRHLLTGFASLNYYAWVANQGTGAIQIYESGPSDVGLDDIRWKVEGNTNFAELTAMTFDPATYPGSETTMPGGVYVTHRDAQTGLPMVSRACWTIQLPVAGPLPPVPPPGSVLSSPGIFQRHFEVVGTWGGPLQPMNQQLNVLGNDQHPADLALSDFGAKDFFGTVPTNIRTNLGAFLGFQSTGAAVLNSKHPIRVSMGAPLQTWFPDRMYVSFPGDSRIEVLDPAATGTKLNTINGVPLAGLLTSYFEQ